MKKRITKMLFILVVSGLFIFSASTAVAINFYSLATSSTAGTWYVIGAGFSQHINKYSENIKVTPEITAGSIEDYHLIKRGKVDFALTVPAIVLDDATEDAYGGNPEESINVILWSDHTSDYHFFTRKKSDIDNMCDIKGKDFGVGPHGTAGMKGSLDILRALCDYEPDEDYNAHYYTYAEAQKGIQDNTLDMGVTCAGYPVGSVINLSETIKIKMISFTDEEVEKVLNYRPSWASKVIPAGTYKGVDYDVQTFAIPTGMIVRKDVPEEDVYEFVKALYSHQDKRNKFHPVAKEYTVEKSVKYGKKYAKKMGVPFHPGVVKYLKEVGAWTPELSVK